MGISNIKESWESSLPQNLRKKVSQIYGKNEEYNPFLDKDGNIFNKYIDYQKILDNPSVTQNAKNYISKATGLTPTEGASSVIQKYSSVIKPNSTVETGSYTDSVGKRVANTATYNNSAAKGQCVWYVRGRASEKLGKTVGALGNANQMWYNAKPEAQLTATADNIKPNMIVSYSKGTSSAGQKAGHVIFIEDVVGDTVYYTEGGSGYYKNGTDGVIKTASRQGILDGVNSNGGRMGSGVIGFIDLSKY